MKRIVSRYILAESTVLTIDAEFLKKYPVQRNGARYSMFGHVKGLELNQVAETDIGAVVSCFGHLQRFTMRRVTIIDGISGLPWNLTDLKLINVKIEKDLLNKFITRVKETLINLHLDRVQTFFVFGSVDKLGMQAAWDCILGLDLKVMCPNLKSLVFLGDVVWLNGKGVKLTSLKIVAKELQADIYEFKHLEYFYLDVLKSVARPVLQENEYQHMTRLRSLTLKCWWTPSLESLEYLDYLRIILPVDPRQKNYIDNLKIKCVHVEYYDYAEEPNLILKVLNNECLMHVLRYLSLKDCFSFGKTNRRVHGLVKEHRFPVMKVGIYTFGHLFTNEGNNLILKHLAPSVKKLHVIYGSLFWIIPYCTSLKKLELSTCCSNFKEEDVKILPTALDSFSITYGCGQKDNWNIVGPYIRRLQNVREINIKNCPVKFVIDFIRNNVKTLEHFFISKVDVENWENVWNDLSLAKNLKNLTLDLGKELTINEATILKEGFSKIGKKLQKLTLLNASNENFETIVKLKSLQKLKELNVQVPSGDGNVNALKTMKELTWIRLAGVSNVSEAIDLIGALPKLVRVELPSFRTNIQKGIKTEKRLQNYGDKIRFD